MTANLSAPGRVLSDHAMEEVRSRLVSITMDTFRLRPMPSGGITESELTDRMDVTVEIWNHLYGECRWSKDRALDHILDLLVKTIDGARLKEQLPEPGNGDSRDGATTWAPDKLKDIEAERRLSALAAVEGHVIQQEKPTGGETDDNGGQE